MSADLRADGALAPFRRRPRIDFTPVRADDLPLLSEWLRRPHWREWWGDPEVELGYIRDMVEGREATLPFLFHLDGVPSGYIQLWFIGPHQIPDWADNNPWLLELPADAVGVDLSIADPGQLSRGIGSAVLRTFVDRLRQEGHTTIIIDPDPSNARAVAAYRKAGFRPVPHLEGRTEEVLIMQHRMSQNPR
jgi:RimJ/RimL family protein N-acetyltransferase